MKPITVKAAGKGWNARVVAGMDKDTFIADKAHAIEGETPENNAKILAGVWDTCSDAVKAATPTAAAVAAPEAKSSKK